MRNAELRFGAANAGGNHGLIRVPTSMGGGVGGAH